MPQISSGAVSLSYLHFLRYRSKGTLLIRTNQSGLFWALLLIGVGAVALAQQIGYIDPISDPPFWMWVSAVVSFVSVIEYAQSGWKKWGWLFPAGVFGGLAVTILLATSDVVNAAFGSPLFFGLTVPFAAAYLTDRSRNWWALIPGGMMIFLSIITLLVGSADGNKVGALFLFMIALVFLAVYLNNQTHIWALLVAYILAVLGIAPLVTVDGREVSFFGAVFVFAVALPFLITYLRSSQNNWWAIIPTGSLTSIAVITALVSAGWIRGANAGAYANALLIGELAATFAVVWLRHARSWARTVTIILATMAVASVLFVSHSQMIWPVTIILLGVYMFYTALRPKAF